MTASEQPLPSDSPHLLAEHLTALLLMTVALFFTAIIGIPTALQGKIRLLFSYWQCLPCLLSLLSVCLIANKAENGDCVQRIKLAAFAMLALSPFPTWTTRSNENAYLEICAVACLAASLWMQMEICQWLQKLAEADKIPILALSAKKTQFLLLCFSIIPLSALYGSGLLGLYTGTSRSLQDVIRVWDYGRISMIMRVLLYWCILQFMTLCLYATCVAARQVKKTLAKQNLGQN